MRDEGGADYDWHLLMRSYFTLSAESASGVSNSQEKKYTHRKHISPHLPENNSKNALSDSTTEWFLCSVQLLEHSLPAHTKFPCAAQIDHEHVINPALQTTGTCWMISRLT